MIRSLCLLAALVFAACAGETSDTPPSVSVASASTSGPVQVNLVTDNPDVRQRLTPPQLLSYFPDHMGDREAQVGARYLKDGADENSGSSHAIVLYRDWNDPSSAVIEVMVADFVDDPASRDYQKSIVEEGEGLNSYGGGAMGPLQRLDDGAIARTNMASGDTPYLYLMLADRFFVQINTATPTENVDTDDLWAMYEESGLAALAGAPVYADAGEPDVPAWATEAVSEWEPTPAAASEPAPAVEPLASCDVLLPVAEVERVCGMSGLQVFPTDFETEGTNCNRKYGQPGQQSGLLLLVSRYSDASQAQGGLRVAIDTENQRDRRDVSGLGDAAVRFTHDLETLGYNNHLLTVAQQGDLIEMKSGAFQDEPGQQVCSLDQMETLAGGLTERLRP